MSDFLVGDRVTYTGSDHFCSGDMVGMTGTVQGSNDGGTKVKWDDKPTNAAYPFTTIINANLSLIDNQVDPFDDFKRAAFRLRAAGYKVEAKVTPPAETVEV